MCHEDFVGGRREVATMETRLMVGRLEVNSCHSVDDVEEAIVRFDRLAVAFGSREDVAFVLDENRAEVLEVTLVAGVRGSAAPKSLLVELNIVAHDTTSNGCAYLAVAHGKSILHPSVGDACRSGWCVVPKGEVVNVTWSCTFLTDAKLGRLNIGFGDEIQDVIDVGSLPETYLLAWPCAAPLIEVTVG